VLRGALLSVGLWLDDRGIMGQYRRHSSFAEGSTGVMVEGSLEASACIAMPQGLDRVCKHLHPTSAWQEKGKSRYERENTRGLSSRPFCSCNGRRVSLEYSLNL
jgi:hypothetical protein